MAPISLNPKSFGVMLTLLLDGYFQKVDIAFFSQIPFKYHANAIKCTCCGI